MKRILQLTALASALLASPAFSQTPSTPYDEIRREIGALAERLERLEAENQTLKERNDKLEQRLTAQAPAAPAATDKPAPAPAAAAVPWYDNLKISGYVIGDANAVLSNHDPVVDDQTNFWIRRAYLSFDSKMSDTWSSRLRFEANSPGDYRTSSKLNPFVKDAYLAWKDSGKELYLGISPSPTWEFVEGFWGYRSVEKTALDLYRMGSSRDFGVAYKGKGFDNKIAYHVMLGNGAGEASETNDGKKAMVSVGFMPNSALSFELYADHEDRPASTDRTAVRAFAGWRGQSSRIGFEYGWQDRDAATGPGEDVAVASLFGVWRLSEKSSLITRWDRSFDGFSDADKIPYVPIAKNMEFDLAILGWDYKLHKQISLIPNLEYISYRDTNGVSAPDDDLYAKITLYYQF